MHTSEWRVFRLSWPETANVVHASVLAGATETRYMRTGTGRPVLLLLDDPEAGGVGRALVEALRPGFRVLVPEAVVAADGDGPAFSAWMRAFLDGLGASPVSVVARGACAVAALCFALCEPERVDRLVLLYTDVPDAATPDHAVADRLDGAGLPLLVIHEDVAGVDGSTDESTARVADAVARFLQASA